MSVVLDSINLPGPDSTKIANTKLLCVYNKLTTSPTFKNLFINIFGESENLNVTFKVTKDLSHTKPNGDIVRDNGLTSTLSGQRSLLTGLITDLEIQIEIDEELLTTNSNFNIAKTILHESIHAYLTLTQLNHNPAFPLDYYDNLTINDILNIAANSLRNGSVTQHEFMFDYMLPIFQNVFTEIGNENLASQDDINRFTNDSSLNWQDFYHYFSMQGLHTNDAFINAIVNDANELAKFNLYVVESDDLSKECN